jgi:hypothetical protein
MAAVAAPLEFLDFAGSAREETARPSETEGFERASRLALRDKR